MYNAIWFDYIKPVFVIGVEYYSLMLRKLKVELKKRGEGQETRDVSAPCPKHRVMNISLGILSNRSFLMRKVSYSKSILAL